MENKYKILIPLIIAGAMGTVDTSVMNVAMPTLAEVFKVEMQTVSWISSAYLLVLAGLLLTAGRLGDIYGYKKPFEWGLFIFTVGTALCGCAPSLVFLIAARVFQAIGTSLFIAAIPAMIVSFFPPKERGKAMGLNVVSVSIGLTLGPSLGGLLLSRFIWRYIFFINIPLGIVALLTSKIFIPEKLDKREGSFDYKGTILAFIFLASLLFYINRGSSIGWMSNTSLILILTSIVSFTVFIFQEKKAPEPMLDLSLFSNNAFVAGLVCNFMYFLAQVVMVFLTPFLLTAAKYPPGIIGLAVTAFPLAMMVFAPVGGFLSDKANPYYISAMGGIIAGLSVLLLGTLPLSFSVIDIVWRMIIFGIGGGLFETSNSVIVLNNAPEHRRGIASGVLAMVRNTGMVFGVAISSTLSSLRCTYHTETLLSLTNEVRDVATIKGIKDVFIMAFICALACAIIAFIGASQHWRGREIVN